MDLFLQIVAFVCGFLLSPIGLIESRKTLLWFSRILLVLLALAVVDARLHRKQVQILNLVRDGFISLYAEDELKKDGFLKENILH